MSRAPAAARRPVDGVVLLDKPVGLSSNAALQIVKRLFRARKAGHTGSLDPLASGMLPICLGEATKLSGLLLNSDKQYRFACRLGVTTSTGDAEGEVIETRPVPALAEGGVRTALSRFVGPIEQIPPMYSALKHQGQRLYQLARRGVEVERPPRRVTIHRLELVELSGTRLVCEVGCSKGTYVRTLGEDIGAALGCGAHVIELRRLAVAPYEAGQMAGLDRVRAAAAEDPPATDRFLLPVDSAVAGWPRVVIRGDAAAYVRNGHPVFVPKAPTSGWVRLYEHPDRFLGIGEILDDGRVAPRRLIGRT